MDQNAEKGRSEAIQKILAKNSQSAMQEIAFTLAQRGGENKQVQVLMVQGKTAKLVFVVLGPVLAVVGLVLLGIGMGSLVSSIGTFEQPRYFLLVFLGLPLLFVGMVLCMMGYFGSFFRYFASEVTPVQKDAFNYLADGTKEGVRTVATAIGEGVAAGMNAAGKVTILCPDCKHANEADAKYCKNCGTPIVR